MDQQLIGARIRQARQHARLTQQALADAVGISQSYIQRFETAEREPSLGQLSSIAEAVNVPLHELLGPNLREPPPVLDIADCHSPSGLLKQCAAPAGLRDLANSTALHTALEVHPEDWQALAAIAAAWPRAALITRDGWAAILLTLRGMSMPNT